MARTQILPLDVLGLVFQNLAESPATLTTCALVCKQWLSPSRRYLQSLKDIKLEAKPADEREEALHEMLLNSEPECSFWPHIHNLSFEDSYTTESSETCIRLILKSLSFATNLRTLQLQSIAFPTLSKDTFPKNNTISSLCLKRTTFASPVQLLRLLASLQNLHSELKLEAVRFSNPDSDFDEPNFVPHPSLPVHFTPYKLNDILPLILRYKWNVTSISTSTPKTEGVDLYNQLLQHIGPSLETVEMGIDDPWELDDEDELDEEAIQRRNDPGVISFEHNTNLREIWTEKLVVFESLSGVSRPYKQLASILATVSSREKFESVHCWAGYEGGDPDDEVELMMYEEDDDNEEKYRFVESFNWKALDDVLGDEERFPGKGPSFEIGLENALLNDTVTESDVIRTKEPWSRNAGAVEKYGVYAAINTCYLQIRQISRAVAEPHIHEFKFNYLDFVDTAAPFLLNAAIEEIVQKLPRALVVPWVRYYEFWKNSIIVCERDAEVTFLSSDHVKFKIHLMNLEVSTGGFPPSDFKPDPEETTQLSEDAETLEVLFAFIYPSRHPTLEYVGSALLFKVADAAEKYEVYGAMNTCYLQIKRLACQGMEPLKIGIYGFKHDYPDCLDEVAPFLLNIPLKEMPNRCKACEEDISTVVFKVFGAQPLKLAPSNVRKIIDTVFLELKHLRGTNMFGVLPDLPKFSTFL